MCMVSRLARITYAHGRRSFEHCQCCSRNGRKVRQESCRSHHPPDITPIPPKPKPASAPLFPRLQGFAERKVLLLIDAIAACKRTHNDEVRRERQAAARVTVAPSAAATGSARISPRGRATSEDVRGDGEAEVRKRTVAFFRACLQLPFLRVYSCGSCCHLMSSDQGRWRPCSVQLGPSSRSVMPFAS